MNPKRVTFDQDAKAKLLEGVDVVYKAVSNTFGPRSNNVAIGRPFGTPAVVHDGVSVAKALLPLEDEVANIGAEILADAADKTNKIGDGTTTATILGREIVTEAHKRISAGYRPMAIREGIEFATKEVVKNLHGLAKPIALEDVERVATIAAQNPELGRFVAEGMKQVGKDGIVTVDESRSTETKVEVKQGMQFGKGYRSPYFVTDPQKGEAVVEDAYVLVTNHKISEMADFAPAIEEWAKAQIKNYVIIADDIDGHVLAFLALNKVQGNINVIAVQAPSFGDDRDDRLKDIALMTGATFVDKSAGKTIVGTLASDLGRVTRAVSTKDSTLLVGGSGAEEDVKGRIEELKTRLKSPDVSEFESERLQERIAKMGSGVAVVQVGAKSESELKERKERVIDAISAAKAALQEGIVPGGGMALVSAAAILSEPQTTATLDREQYAGADIVYQACMAPFRKLMDNAGYDAGEKWALLAKEPVGHGVDVTDGQIKDMVEAGIVDPLSVVRSALENAASAAATLATTNTIITEVPQGNDRDKPLR